jgi:hypothetical protein
MQMTNYDDLFEATAPADSVFVGKRALDPLAEPEDIFLMTGRGGSSRSRRRSHRRPPTSTSSHE